MVEVAAVKGGERIRADADVRSPSAAPAIAAALFFAALIAVSVPYFDLVLRGTRLVYSHLPIAPLMVLLLLLGLRRLGLACLDRRQLLLVYGILLGSASLASSGCADLLLSVVTAPHYFSSPENRYGTLLAGHVPAWFAPREETAVRYFYERLPEGVPLPFGPWLRPLSAWALFIAAFVLMNLGLCSLLRRRWADDEKLLFPLVQVPVEVVDSVTASSGQVSLLHNRLFWIGFAVPALLHSLNALHFHFPAVPAVPLANERAGTAFVERPLTELSGLRVHLLFSVMGIAYLLSSEVACGLWLFYLFHLFERVLLNWAGIQGGGSGALSPSLVCRYHEVGAFIALAGYLLWAARSDLLPARRPCAAGPLSLPDMASVRPSSPRWALPGFCAGFAGLVAWLSAAGMSAWAAALFVGLFLVIALTLTRLVAAGGVLFVECSFLPQDVLNMTFGSANVGARSLTVLAFPEMIFMFEQQTILTPYLMDSLRAGQEGRVPPGQLVAGLALAAVVTVPLSLGSALTVAYKNGALALDPWYMNNAPNWPLKRLAGVLSDPTSGPDRARLVAAGLGAGFFLLLMALQRAVAWWPVHPLGFVMGSTFTMSVMWTSILLGWAIKAAILRWGSLSTYRQAKPAFLGLIIGEYVIAFLWLLIDWAAHKPGHNVFPQF